MLSERIKGLRKASHLSQPDFAKKIGVHVKSVKNWENAVSEPCATNIVKICNYFNISADELLERTLTDSVSINMLCDSDKRKIKGIVQLFIEQSRFQELEGDGML